MSAVSMPVHAQNTRYTFGIVPQQTASKLLQSWTPLLRKMEEITGLEFEFRTESSIPEFEEQLRNGAYDFAYMNPYHYTVFAKHPGYSAFAKASDKKITGLIVVHKDSSIKTVHDLEGKTIAFPSPAAFAATILNRSNLKNSGIKFDTAYVNSHDSVYASVARGIYPAGGAVLRTLNNTASSYRDQLRVLWTSKGYTPHAFASHPRISANVRKSVITALLQINKKPDEPVYKILGIKSIEQARDSDWNDVRKLNINILE